MTYQIESTSSDATFALGEQFGRRCRGGEVFVLSSDLGGGKTTLTKGLAKGMGVEGTVASPTFTISRTHTGRDELELHHFDFYRLNDPGIIKHELAEVLDEPTVVCAVEWGDIVEDVLPAESIVIRIERTAASEDARLLHITLPETRSYLKEDT